MKIPAFKDGDRYNTPTIHTTPIRFMWEDHVVVIKRWYYFDDSEMNCNLGIVLDGIKVDNDLTGDNDDLTYELTDFLVSELCFDNYLKGQPEEPSEEFCEAIEFILKAHLKSLKETV